MRSEQFKKLSPLLFWGASLLFLGIFIKLSSELVEDLHVQMIDQKILRFIESLRQTFLNGAAVDMTALGSFSVLTLFTFIACLSLFLLGQPLNSAFLILSSSGAGLLTYFMKIWFGRERPDVIPRLVDVSGLSYPSGHTLAATSFYLSLAIILLPVVKTRRAQISFLACAALVVALIGFSRLYLGVHYPSDVLSGICLGASWSLLLAGLISYVGPL